VPYTILRATPFFEFLPTIVGDPQTRFFGTTLSGGELTISDGARIGAMDFDAWLVTEGLGVSGGPGER